jgi:alcohol dehydrogenase (cytochrome c)
MLNIHRALRALSLATALLSCVAAINPAHAESSKQSEYAANCAGCHGVKMGGAFGPPLSGKPFKDKWAAQGASAMLTLISTKMPPAKPGALDAKVYERLTNAILAKNGLPRLGTTGATSAAKAKTQEGSSVSGGAGDAGVNEDAPYRAAKAKHAALINGLSPVTDAMLRNPPDQDWLNWRRTDDGLAFSPIKQINAGNADRLQLAWSLSLPAGSNQITPVVHDGVMFVNSNGVVQALDAGNGDLLWKFAREASPVTPAGPPTTQPRNMAISGARLFVPTLDNHIVALDVRTGALLWDHLIEKSAGVLRLTGGPIVVHDKVIQGVSGCSGAAYPGGCFIVALDGATGKEAWRFNTIARPGQPGGDTWNEAPLSQRFGGSVWLAGTYDAELNLVFFGAAQTYHIAPLMQPKSAKAGSTDALYTDSTLALNPDTGALVWYYQHQARELWDLDWAFERSIVTLQTARGPTKAVVTMGKLGILDALDAKTGRYLFSHDVGLQNLVTAIDPVTGHKTTDPALEPEAGKQKLICPFPGGVRSWPATAFDPTTRTLFVPMTESCMKFEWKPGEGWDILYTLTPRPDSDGNFGRTEAINLDTNQRVWQIRRRAPAASALLATAGGVILEGSRDRWFRVSESATGKVLWQARLDLTPNAFPISYAKDGTQYVSITAGGGGPVDVSWQALTPEIQNPGNATTLWVFKLPEGMGKP